MIFEFKIQRYEKNADGIYVSQGAVKDLENDFGFIRYKSLSGINSRGEIKTCYEESYPESEAIRLYQAPEVVHGQITSVLALYVFGANPGVPTLLDNATLISNAINSWQQFCEYIENGLILWTDNARGRKALFYKTDAVDPKSDVIKGGIPYLHCEIKLKNVFGTTFPNDDKTIENWLNTGGQV